MIIDIDELTKPAEKYLRNKYKKNTVHAVCLYCGRKTGLPTIVNNPILNRPLKQDLSHYESSTKAGPLSYSPAILTELQSTVFLCPTPQKVFVSVDVLLPYI